MFTSVVTTVFLLISQAQCARFSHNKARAAMDELSASSIEAKIAKIDALLETISTTEVAQANARARLARVGNRREQAWFHAAVREIIRRNPEAAKPQGDAQPNLQKEEDDGKTCGDISPDCAQIKEDPQLAACQVVDPHPVAFYCAETCNTPYNVSHCAGGFSIGGEMATSPCDNVKTFDCQGGHRAPQQCKFPFEYKGKTYTSCTTDGDFFGRLWCAGNSTYDSDHWHKCEECKEEPLDGHDELWVPVAQSLRCSEVAMTAGTKTGMKYVFENKGMKAHSVVPAASAGKWVGAVGIAGAVKDGLVEWDTRIADIFSWWTKDPADARSRVTLRHLLTFTSGFIDIEGEFAFTHDVFTQRCLTPGFNLFYTPEQCAQQIYETAKFQGEPGKFFEYNSFHLQLAMAMVVTRSGLTAREYFKKYLYEPCGMEHMYYLGEDNPFMAGGLMATVMDYGRFLQKYVAYEVLPKEVIDVLETEYKVAQNTTDISSIPFPNYAMCNMEASKGCRTMGGALANMACHAEGESLQDAFYVMAPPLQAYIEMGAALQGGAAPRGNILTYGALWISGNISKALAADA